MADKSFIKQLLMAGTRFELQVQFSQAAQNALRELERLRWRLG
jgi:hypothetical protein